MIHRAIIECSNSVLAAVVELFAVVKPFEGAAIGND